MLEIGSVNSFHQPISEMSRDRGNPSTYFWKLSAQFREKKWHQNCMKNKNYIAPNNISNNIHVLYSPKKKKNKTNKEKKKLCLKN